MFPISRFIGNLIKKFHNEYFGALEKVPKIQLKRVMKERPKIGMAVLCFERPEYLEKCLNSLFNTNIYDYDISFLLIDDGSKDPRVRELIEAPRGPIYKITRVFTAKGPNSWGGAFNKAIRHLMEIDDFDIIGTCDSDAYFHPEWLRETLRIAKWAKENHRENTLGPFSSFNSSDQDFHEIMGTYQSPYGKYVVKKRMGALNYFYYKDDFLKLGFFDEDRDDETKMTEHFKKLRVRNFSTYISYVEHLGEESILNNWRPVAVKNHAYATNKAHGNWLKKINGDG